MCLNQLYRIYIENVKYMYNFILVMYLRDLLIQDLGGIPIPDPTFSYILFSSVGGDSDPRSYQHNNRKRGVPAIESL